jgi:hypothetical protein
LEEFLLKNYSFIAKLVESIAAITGLICYKKYRHTHQKYFIWFLIYIVLLDFFGSYTIYVAKYEFLEPIKEALKGTLIEKNYWVFTFFWSIGAILFFAFYYQKIIINKHFKRIIYYATCLFLLCSTVYIFLNINAFFKASIPFIKVSGATIIFMCVIFYFIELLKSDEVLTFYKSLNFYISSTIFIWWLVTTPVVFFEIYFSSADWNFVFLRWQIFLFMNIFMYLTFSFALLWCKPQND